MSRSPLRVAYCSPLPPEPSGIADYSAELVPQLAGHLEVELVGSESVVRARGGRGPGDLPLVNRQQLHAGLAAGRYDLVLYHLGNDARFHGWIYDELLRRPGLLVLHEYGLHHLVQGLTLGRGEPAAYVEALRYSYGASGEAMGRRSLASGIPVDPWAYPLFERAVDASLGVLVHNQTTRQRVLASRPRAHVAVVPHHLSLAELEGARGAVAAGEARAAARAELGLADDALVVASFGFLTPQKRLDVALAAFARLRRRYPEARYLLVGELQRGYELAERLAGQLGAGVTVTGRLELSRFLAAMAACDVAINLRHPTAGETSGTLIRLLGLGKAVVVNDHGAFAEIPDGCCAKVPLGDDEVEQLAAILERLAADGELRRQMGANARRHMAREHRLEDSAAGYAAFARQLLAAGAQPTPRVPPLAPYPDHDLLAALAAELGRELTDLGVAEDDDELLAGVAATLVDLDLDLDRAEGRAEER